MQRQRAVNVSVRMFQSIEVNKMSLISHDLPPRLVQLLTSVVQRKEIFDRVNEESIAIREFEIFRKLERLSQILRYSIHLYEK